MLLWLCALQFTVVCASPGRLTGSKIIMGKMLSIREFDLANLRAFIFRVHLFLDCI